MSMMPLRRRRRLGSAAIEFALVGPLFILMLMAMVVYGGWFWLAQGVQTLASEGARAAIAGLDAAERETLARAAIDTAARDGAGLDPDRLTVSVVTDDEAIRVRLRLDLQDHWVIALAGPVPRPPVVIERSAILRTGGV